MELLDLSDPTLWGASAAALAAGLVIGLERQLRGHAAGIRTCALIALASMLFARMGIALDSRGGDPTRMVGQIVVGVGFLGAGVIFNRQRVVHGMTSAAVIWILAAIGALAGVGAVTTALATAALALVVLVVVGVLEDRVRLLQRGDHARPERPEQAAAAGDEASELHAPTEQAHDTPPRVG